MNMCLFLVLLVLSLAGTINAFTIPSNRIVKRGSISESNHKTCQRFPSASIPNTFYGQSSLELASSEVEGGFDAAAWLNPNTRGGVIVWSVILILIPIGFYNFFVATGMEETKVGAYVGAIFVLLSNVLWASTYVFRVANKDMTYAQQLRDYENAVLQKRLEELADDEINALMEEIELEEKGESINKE